MTARSFLDTNILVYTDDFDSREKRARALDLIEALHSKDLAVLSTQVLQEYFAATTRTQHVDAGVARDKVALFAKFSLVTVSADIVLRAIDRHRVDKLSFWDCLIVEAALIAGCTVLYSEDMQVGRRFGALQVVNPFAD